jgi:hypothetical protein
MGLARAFADNVLALAMDAQLTLSDEERAKVTGWVPDGVQDGP